MRTNLILWRHAEAEDGPDDLARRLTPRGHKQAAKMARWLTARLPERFRLISSEALRAQETAASLGHRTRSTSDSIPVPIRSITCLWFSGPKSAAPRWWSHISPPLAGSRRDCWLASKPTGVCEKVRSGGCNIDSATASHRPYCAP